MKSDSGAALYFAVKLDSRLREAFAMARPADKKYLDAPEFLQTFELGGDKWVGKVVAPGPSTVEAEDIQRNVSSILHRVAPQIRILPTMVKILVVQPTVAPEVIGAEEDIEDVADAGPYIADA